MKKLLLFIIILCSTCTYAQDTIQKDTIQKKTGTREDIRFYYIWTGAVGNNFLNEGHKGANGIGIAANLFTYYRYHLMLGGELTRYDITNKSVTGNFEYTNVNKLYLQAMYKHPISGRVNINSTLSVGVFQLKQHWERNRTSSARGPIITPGLDIDFRLFDTFKIFAGVQYGLLFPEANTRESYKSYFGTLQQLNFCVGIKG